MHIAFLHNLQTEATPEQAEFDTPETVNAIVAALEELGHQVTPVDAASSLPLLVSRLQLLDPDLVLNTAEGTQGRGREGFYPGLLEQLHLPYTGSDAYVCTLTLDKQLTNMALGRAGIPVPQSLLATRIESVESHSLRFPLIAKPNFEGSSKGVDQDSVASDQDQLLRVLERLLGQYPSGILIEEFIEGRDVTVPYIEGVGVLEPAHYEFAGPPRRYSIYDYDLKQNRPDDVQVVCPAAISDKTRKLLASHTKKAVEVLGVRDFCRVDYRVTPQGDPVLIEVNALPSLEPGAAIYLAASRKGLTSIEETLNAILKSAMKRQKRRHPSDKMAKLKVGVVHNLKRAIISSGADEEAEFDSQATVDALCQAIRLNGYEAIPLEARPELPAQLKEVDIAFNIAEGRKGRYRESQIPALLELLDIPFTGSEAGSLAVCHDKALAKRLVSQSGVATARFQLVSSDREPIDRNLRYPLLVKPVAEGSSKGVARRSVATTPEELREVLSEMLARYRQPALIEEFLPGREFTVGVLENPRLRVLPIMEITFHGDEQHPIYSFENKQGDDGLIQFKVPAEVDAGFQRRMEKTAKTVFRALGCRDVARIDFRLDQNGSINFIECNPLPGLTPDYSDLCVIGNAAGYSYSELVGQILAPAVKRHRVARAGRARA